MDYKDSLNLPQTDFPMKANLKKRELEQINKWESSHLYQKIRQKFSGREKFIFHDGPPYANGHIHMGHALNKILKDFIVRIMTMRGYDAAFVPGWDCHGLPIEHQVMKELGKNKKDMTNGGIRKLCREYAKKFVCIQREEFKRLGVSAEWDKPYLTMDYSYEAEIVREFGRFIRSGHIYKGLKPVHWCTNCRTALAEAEVEYANHTSPSIYVKFPITSDLDFVFPEANRKPVFFVIWTTTPWTLPANLAVCLHPDFQYSTVQIGEEILIVAKELLNRLLLEWDVKHYRVLGSRRGEELENLVCRHPFIDRNSIVVLGEHVTLEQGTGCVHTAPGHGQDDFLIGKKYGLDVYNPVDDGGIFNSEVKFFGGKFIRDANEDIIEKLRELRLLINDSKIEHPYPHCWRCRQPIIFRATAQWFIGVEHDGLRQKALEAIRQTRWIPHWGEERIYSMIENRPDWCVSRQRIWGAPIAVVICTHCNTVMRSEKFFNHIVRLTKKNGTDFWFENDVSKLIPLGVECDHCGGKIFQKEEDILDVWFDSGVSHAVVLEKNPDLQWPADLYLEGSDQHRGWFHSSLLESIGTRGQAPYRAVLTHGYVVDGKGKKMSKSAGNVIAPQKIIDQYGAEILRLWVASENYREDIRISNEILNRLTEAYRKIRNTFRYLLGNLNDFDASKDKIQFGQMFEIDRYILDRFQKLTQKILKAYENYEFHVFYHSFYNFCVVDLSAFYLDILKDRLYTYPRDSIQRRSGQTSMYELLMGMTSLMAPILSFTADEIWSYLPKGSPMEDSVHLSQFPKPLEVEFDQHLVDKWDLIIKLKGEVSKALEVSRKDKVIGHSLDAKVEMVLPSDLIPVLRNEELQYIFIVSSVELKNFLENSEIFDSEVIPGLKVRVSPCPGKKCERCWNYFSGSETPNMMICPRCVKNLESAKA